MKLYSVDIGDKISPTNPHLEKGQAKQTKKKLVYEKQKHQDGLHHGAGLRADVRAEGEQDVVENLLKSHRAKHRLREELKPWRGWVKNPPWRQTGR